MLHRFLACYVRYAAHVVAYMSLAANPYPGFAGRAGSYPIDVEIDPPGRAEPLGHRLPPVPRAAGDPARRHDARLRHQLLRRLGARRSAASSRRSRSSAGSSCVVARPDAAGAPRPDRLRDRLLGAGERLPVPAHRPLSEQRPGLLRVGERRTATTRSASTSTTTCGARGSPTFFRLPARGPALRLARALGHRGLVRRDRELVRRRSSAGRPSEPLHRFLAAYLRYQTHVYAFVQLVANPFPGFIGRARQLSGRPRDLPRPGARSPGWVTGFRLILAIPALLDRERAGTASPSSPPSQLVLRARSRPSAARAAQPRRVRAPLLRADLRLPLPADRPLSVQPARRPGWQLSLDGSRPRTGRPDRRAAWLGRRSRSCSRPRGCSPPRCCGRRDGPGRPARCRTSIQRDYFSAAFLERASDYERFLRIDFAAVRGRARWSCSRSTRATGERFTRESAAGRIGTGMLLGMLGFAFVWLAQLPFGVAGLWWERRHDISKQGYLEWSSAAWLGLGGQFLFICVAIGIVMALAGAAAAALVDRRRAGVRGARRSLFAFVQPYLMPDLHPLRNPSGARRTRARARAQAGRAEDPREGREGPQAARPRRTPRRSGSAHRAA